ncbi:MAG TPA: LCP family protein [Kineosporiaceae bacterium]|nr:LCP family protein [Kineosporiaceae bacterium]
MSDLSQQTFDEVFSDSPSTPPQAPQPPHKRRRWLIVLGVLGTLVVLMAGSGYYVYNNTVSSWNRNIQRFGDPFQAIPQTARPTADPTSGPAMNILLMGSDSRVSAGNPKSWTAGEQRSDALMIFHVAADRQSAYVISIPRDSWVAIPGHGKAKINAAFSWGGPPLVVQTVESLTGVRIDHLAIIDFEGFKEVTDALGGVSITIPQTTHDMRAEFKAGTYTMNGADALNYVRQRYNLPGGDFDRVKRQQNWIRAVVAKLMSAGTLSDPFKLNNAMNALTKTLEVDNAFTFGVMKDLAVSSRNLRSDNVKFLTVPVAGTGWSPDHQQSIVNLAPAADASLWQAIRKDQVGEWMSTHNPDELGTIVR